MKKERRAYTARRGSLDRRSFPANAPLRDEPSSDDDVDELDSEAADVDNIGENDREQSEEEEDAEIADGERGSEQCWAWRG